jgi:hypothetical protein
VKTGPAPAAMPRFGPETASSPLGTSEKAPRQDDLGQKESA